MLGYDRIVISDTKGVVVDCFDIGADGKLTPIADAELKAIRKTLKEFSDGMKDFDK